MNVYRLMVLATLLIPASTYSEGWGVVGAGNATCTHWSASDSAKRTEILSWMAGFASSENLGRAASGGAEFRMQLLTYEYLSREIESVCSDSKHQNSTISSILFDVLARFPVQDK